MKKTILISYDLGSPETFSDYERIKEYVDVFPDWLKPLKSQWVVISETKSAGDIRDDLIRITDSNDKILVLDITGNSWATARLLNETNAWLSRNI